MQGHTSRVLCHYRHVNWLSRWFGHNASPNPEEYKRVPCDLCKGSGSASDLLAPGESRYLGTRCPICHGAGWLMVKKDPEEVRDTPPKATVAASDAPGATPESFGEVPEDEGRAPETRAAPTAPTAPTAPDGMDDII